MHDANPNPARIQVFRQAFKSFADGFASYAPFLHSIRHEYDTLLTQYAGKISTVPQMQAEIASLRKGASQAIEDLKQSFQADKNELHEKVSARGSRIQRKEHGGC